MFMVSNIWYSQPNTFVIHVFLIVSDTHFATAHTKRWLKQLYMYLIIEKSEECYEPGVTRKI